MAIHRGTDIAYGSGGKVRAIPYAGGGTPDTD